MWKCEDGVLVPRMRGLHPQLSMPWEKGQGKQRGGRKREAGSSREEPPAVPSPTAATLGKNGGAAVSCCYCCPNLSWQELSIQQGVMKTPSYAITHPS